MSLDAFGFDLKTHPREQNWDTEGWILAQYTAAVSVWQLVCILFVNKYTHRQWDEGEMGATRLSLGSIYMWVVACPPLCYLALQSTGSRILAGTEARVLEIDPEGVSFVRFYIALQVVGVFVEGNASTTVNN
jgi:hypothetical protein